MFSFLRSGLRPVGPVWQGASWLIALGVFAPIASLAWLALGADFAHWQNLLRYVLPDAAINTALLLTGVGLLVLLVGTGCAWLVTA
ncbi:MAG: iron ABC transporter permease, partial [Comamonas sp.]